MYKLITILLFVSTVNYAQVLDYTPNRKLDKTIAATYYNTEYIFIRNISDQTQSLMFELLENNLKAEWSSTICTNMTCYSTLPKSGSLGTISAGAEAYISVNLAVNEALGEGNLRYLITSLVDTTVHDTVTFAYTVTEDGSTKAGPWANLNFSQGVLTVLLANAYLNAHLSIYSLSGIALYDQAIGPITSVPLRDFGSGAYLVYIRDEFGREIKKKIVYYSI